MIDDPDRDSDLIRNLGELPPPEVPADLAARIARNVTQLPQQQPIIAPSEAAVAPRKARARRWLPHAIGSAAAACAIAALLVHVIDLYDRTPQPAPSADRPAQPVKVVTGSVEVRLAAASEAAPAPSPAARKPAKSAPRAVRRTLEPEIMPSEGVPLEVDTTPEFAIESSAPIVPVDRPSEREMIGPTDPHGAKGTMPRGGSAPGFGISGSGASMPGPAPHY